MTPIFGGLFRVAMSKPGNPPQIRSVGTWTFLENERGGSDEEIYVR